MTTETARLTEAERNELDDSLMDSGCHGWQGDHPDLYAAAERIIAARQAEVLREAADAVLREFDPPVEACIWASEWLRDRAERVVVPPAGGEG